MVAIFLSAPLPDRAASSEDFEAQRRLVTPVRCDVVTRRAEETRFETLLREPICPRAGLRGRARPPDHHACPSETRAALLLGLVATARGRARTNRPAPCGHGCSVRAPLCRGASEIARALYMPAVLSPVPL